MAKRVFACILVIALLVLMIACDDDISTVDEYAIDLSDGGFFDDFTNTNTADTTGDPDSDTDNTAASNEEISDTKEEQ